MNHLIRFGISIEKNLFEKFDELIRERNYHNRSEAIRDLIREALVQKQWKEGEEVAGVITIIFDHHRRDLLNHLTDIQHDFQELIIATQHIHLDHHHCLEIIACRGDSRLVQKLADTLRAIKGVKQGTLNMSSAGKELF